MAYPRKMTYPTNTISQLLGNLVSASLPAELARLPIQDMALNTEQLGPGWLFVALAGGGQHGSSYWRQAQKAGASAILIDEEDIAMVADASLPCIPVKNLALNLIDLADRFYGVEDIEWSAVTGTNGKSSVAHLVSQSLSSCGIKTAAIGTVYQGFHDQGGDSNFLTTPDPLSLRRLQAKFCRQGAQHIIAEASSHALAQNRLSRLKLTTGILTNITSDHGDYHNSPQEYLAAKRKLFDFASLKQAVFNLDDSYGRKWFRESDTDCLSYSLEDSAADIYAKEISTSPDGVEASLVAMGKTALLRSSLLGNWQLANALASLALLLIKKIPLKDAVAALSQVKALRGRMQNLIALNGARFYIDYAHSADSLRQVLDYLKRLCQGNLWVVFGCGGGRDKDKREVMGQVASAYADRIVLTNDNPRFEDPLAIIAAIKKGIKGSKRVQIELDRSRALDLAIEESSANDLVLVAGKGHENYQEVVGNMLPFNDYDYLTERLC